MIEIKVVSDPATAKYLWNKLSPQKNIYDLWDFRYCFYKHDPQALHFYVAYDDGRPVALLPLQYNQELACLEFFAENFMENNRPFFEPGYEYLLPQLFNSDFGQTVKIYDLDGIDEFTNALPLEDYVYFIDISGFNDFGDYLLNIFSDRKKRAKFRRLATLLEAEHEVKTIFNDFNDLKLILDLNVRRFSAESYLKTGREQQPFYDLLKLPLNWRAVTIMVDGVKLAGSLSVIYRGTYFYMIAGADTGAVPDVFKYLTKVNLELALAEKAKIFNCSLGDCNWKSHWHLDKQPQYKFIKLID
ncbi:MAG: GNAT family N-acetyltransferase [bacterium]|nr:GNAT family N-acetyltransferase [bacterium]